MFQPPFKPTSKERRKRWLIGQKGFWTCLEVVLWGQFQFLSSRYQQSIPKANTKCESVAEAWFSRNYEALLNWNQSTEMTRNSQNTITNSLVLFSLRSYSKRRSLKTSEALHCKQYKSLIPSLLGYNYTLSNHHESAQVCASAKHPLICLLQQNIHS